MIEKGRRSAYLLAQAFTLSRIPMSLAFCLLAINLPRTDTLIFALGVLIGIEECTDFLDGMVARRLGVVSPLGQMLDPYADSISRLIVYWTLGQLGLVFQSVVLVMAIRDVTVAYCRILLAQTGESVSARLGGKIKAHVQGFGAAIAWLGPWYWPLVGTWTVAALSWLVIATTAYSSLDYLRGGLASLRRQG